MKDQFTHGNKKKKQKKKNISGFCDFVGMCNIALL